MTSPALKLQRYTAVVAYACESTDGVEWPAVIEAVGARFGSLLTVVKAFKCLVDLGYLRGLPHPDDVGYPDVGAPGIVIGCADGLQRLRDLQRVVKLIETLGKSGCRVQVGYLRDHPLHPKGWDRDESVHHLIQLDVLGIVRANPGIIGGWDTIKLLDG